MDYLESEQILTDLLTPVCVPLIVMGFVCNKDIWEVSILQPFAGYMLVLSKVQFISIFLLVFICVKHPPFTFMESWWLDVVPWVNGGLALSTFVIIPITVVVASYLKYPDLSIVFLLYPVLSFFLLFWTRAIWGIFRT